MPPALQRRIRTLRAFNRFYTRRIGALTSALHDSPFSLAEARVIYEVAQRDRPTASELAADLGLDPGYLSRMLRGFRKRGLLAEGDPDPDRRRRPLELSEDGRTAFAELDRRSDAEVGALLRRLSTPDQDRLLRAAATVERLLGDVAAEAGPSEPWLLRQHHPGDMGWVVHRHGVLYAEEYGWDQRFEGLVAGIVAEFVEHYDPRRERCWMAEREGEVVGSVFLVRQSDEVAKLRLLLVEPAARGLGIGTRLVGECIRFARQSGYRTLTLWTNDVLHSARRIYEAAGFHRVGREPHDSFGHALVAETWELAL